MPRASSVLTALTLAVLPAAALAEGAHLGHGWMAEPAGDTARIFLTIENEGDVPMTLDGISTEAAASVTLMAPPIKAGEETPVPIPAMTIAPGETLELSPEGLYFLAEGLTAPLTEGQEIDLVLQLSPDGLMETHVLVEGPDAETDSHAGHDH